MIFGANSISDKIRSNYEFIDCAGSIQSRPIQKLILTKMQLK